METYAKPRIAYCASWSIKVQKHAISGICRRMYRIGLSWLSEAPETVIHMIDQMAQAQPNAIAVRYGSTANTYAEISARANDIATRVLEASIPAGSPVAVLIYSSPSWISALLNIMRAGAVYLPLDMSLTWNR
ncbi:hypothetical protein NHQ30_010161 [Ciborinia camelliae]|nr:hypothetical protein NHQ30_010161 [Ciborinia camelliae]